ncbi:hypothetical protein WN990_15160 [Kitasatospora purpeofusca]|uniref:hypothetical protein n=1 Tax=Kitasatospora purpeofusca TaxID=67352 RepID=UPI0030F317F6
MNSRAGRWRLLPVALVAATSVLFLSNSAAFAAEPGESNGWSQEIENNAPVYSDGDMSEARDPNSNTLLQVWRGWTNNNIYMSVNHGAPIQMGGAQTNVTPVVAYDTHNGNSSYFRVFHTGVNGFVFYSNIQVTNNLVNPSAWYQVPNDVRTPNNMPVSVTTLPSRGIILAYRGQDSNNIYSTFFNGQNGFWDLPLPVASATSNSAPAVSFEPSSQIILLTWRGTDNQVNVIRQSYGSGNWWGQELMPGVLTDAQPAIAMANVGRGQIAVRQQGSQRLQLTTVGAAGGWAGGWSAEVNGFVARYGPTLVAYAATVYILATTGSGGVWWKQSRQY